MKESITTELETLLKRHKELRKERTELEHEMVEWKKEYLIMPEYEKKQLAICERILAESDKKMLLAEAKFAQIRKIL